MTIENLTVVNFSTLDSTWRQNVPSEGKVLMIPIECWYSIDQFYTIIMHSLFMMLIYFIDWIFRNFKLTYCTVRSLTLQESGIDILIFLNILGYHVCWQNAVWNINESHNNFWGWKREDDEVQKRCEITKMKWESLKCLSYYLQISLPSVVVDIIYIYIYIFI